MKGLLGTPNLAWDVTKKQGAYSGPVFDASANLASHTRHRDATSARARARAALASTKPQGSGSGGSNIGLPLPSATVAVAAAVAAAPTYRKGDVVTYTHSNGQKECVTVVHVSPPGPDGLVDGVTVHVPSLGRERSTVPERLSIDGGRLMPAETVFQRNGSAPGGYVTGFGQERPRDRHEVLERGTGFAPGAGTGSERGAGRGGNRGGGGGGGVAAALSGHARNIHGNRRSNDVIARQRRQRLEAERDRARERALQRSLTGPGVPALRIRSRPTGTAPRN